MSVHSVRVAIKKAMLDNKLTSDEARGIVQVAARTSGINAAERVELEKLAATPNLDSFAKSTLKSAIIRATPAIPAGEALKAATQSIVQQRGVDVLSGLKTVEDNSTLTQGLRDSLERFTGAYDMQDGDSILVREMRVGREIVYVAADFNGEDKELVGFFDRDGKEIGRAVIAHEEEKISMKWDNNGSVIAAYGKTGADVSPDFKKKLITHLKSLDEQLEGTEIAPRRLPDILRRHYEYMERTIADGTSAETFQFDGQHL